MYKMPGFRGQPAMVPNMHTDTLHQLS